MTGGNYMEKSKQKRLGTFDGVYVPTLLTILGVVMYLRLGWVVGNSGFLGTLAIIIIAHIITFSTVFSMSTIVSNFKIEDGGAYAIICRSLGMEWGGAVGIPLYFSQAFSVAFYIIGFVEVWVSFFPNTNVKVISFAIWLVLFIISYISAELAFKIQYFILVAVVVSIGAFLLGTTSPEVTTTFLMGSFGEETFWNTFAIFFPAVTGVLAGVTMSGELKNPSKSIIKGTFSAVSTGFVVYIIMAYWFAHQATEAQLLNNSSLIFDLVHIPVLVIVGVLGAVISSALSTLVGAPRTLNALAQNRAVFFSKFLAKKSKNGEPRNAIIVSSLISLTILLGSNLNALAEILTLFFLTTYGMINLVAFLEKKSGITSFRPTLTIPTIVPVVGFIGCMFSMILINKLFTIITIVVIVFIYVILKKKNLESPWGDVRGGIFTMVAEWAGQKAMSMPYHPRLWKPSVLIPVQYPQDFKKLSPLIEDMIYPAGRLYCLSINNDDDFEDPFMDNELNKFKKKSLFANKIIVKGEDFYSQFPIIMQSLQQTFLPPNSVLFTISSSEEKRKKLIKILYNIDSNNIGIICARIHPDKEFGERKSINLWVRSNSPNLNLAILTAMKLKENWNAKLTLIRVTDKIDGADMIIKEMMDLIDDARLPVNTKVKVLVGSFNDLVFREKADLTILGMPPEYEDIHDIALKMQGSVLYIKDSGLENA